MLETWQGSPRHAPAYYLIAIAEADDLPHPVRLKLFQSCGLLRPVPPVARKSMRISNAIILLLAFAAPAQAQPVQITGKLGYLSEWEIAATVDEHASPGKKEFSGPVIVRHVGVCAPGRPVEMSGEIRYQISGWTRSRMKATLLIDGIEC